MARSTPGCDEGCLTVEMEAAGFFAVAAFRGVTFGQVLYAGDDLSGDAWDQRGWDEHTTGRETVFRIAAEAVLTLAPDSLPARPGAERAGPPISCAPWRPRRRSTADVPVGPADRVFALSVVTFGLYWLYWYYRANDDIRMYLRNYSIRPLVSTLAIVGLFPAAPLVVVAILAESWWLLAVAAVLVLMGWVGFLHTGRRVITAQEQAGVEPSSAGLALFSTSSSRSSAAHTCRSGLNRAWSEAAGDERERLAAAAAAGRRGPVKPFPGPGRSRARTS